jgi:hypothetical protein
MAEHVHSDRFFREARTDLDGPLHGVRVLEVATTWAGPRCAALLADYGADVIKVVSGARIAQGQVVSILSPLGVVGTGSKSRARALCTAVKWLLADSLSSNA